MDLVNLSFNFIMEGLAEPLFGFLIVFIVFECLVYIITKFIFWLAKSLRFTTLPEVFDFSKDWRYNLIIIS